MNYPHRDDLDVKKSVIMKKSKKENNQKKGKNPVFLKYLDGYLDDILESQDISKLCKAHLIYVNMLYYLLSRLPKLCNILFDNKNNCYLSMCMMYLL